jgi:hypothetical protein
MAPEIRLLLVSDNDKYLCTLEKKENYSEMNENNISTGVGI